MAGTAPPSTDCSADLGKDVDALPAQAMTVWVGRAPNGAVTVARRQTATVGEVSATATPTLARTVGPGEKGRAVTGWIEWS